MGFSLGGSKNHSSTNSNSNTNQTSTSTPIIPSYVQGDAQNYYTSLGNLMNMYMPGQSNGGMAGSTAPTGLTGGAQPNYYVQPGSGTTSGQAPVTASNAVNAAQTGNAGTLTGAPSSTAQTIPASTGTPATATGGASLVTPSGAQASTGQDWDQLLKDRPDVMAEYQRASAAADKNSPAYTQKGLDSPENYAKYWFNNMGGSQSYDFAQPTGSGVPTTQTAQAPTQNLIPGYSPLQTLGYQNAMNLGSNQGYYQAGGLFAAAGGAAPTSTAAGANIDPTSNVGVTQVGNTSMINDITLDPAAQYAGATMGPTAQSGQVNLGPTSQYQGSSLLSNLGSYMSPYTNSVVNSTLALNDQQNQKDQAKLEAQGALSGAFGGSRFGLAQGNLLQNQQLANANITSNLFNTGYNQATANSNLDADRRQSANAANASALNTANLQQGNMNLNNNQYNATQANNATTHQADLYQQAGLSNQDALNARNLAQGTLTYNVGNANSSAKNAATAQQAQLDAAKAQADAAAENARAMQQAQLQQQNSQFNAQEQDAAANRALAAAGIFGNLGTASGNSANQDIATQIAAGNNDRSTQFDINSAPLQQAAAIQALLGINPSSLFGSTSTGNTNTTGKSSTTGYGIQGGATWG